MRLVLLNEIPEDAILRQEWDQLVMGVPNPQVFYTYEWALAVHRAYKQTLGALLFLGYDGDRLIGIAALATGSQSGQVSFLASTTGDYCDFISSTEHRAEFVSSVLAELKKQGFPSVTLANLPVDSDSNAVLREASSRNGYHFFARTAYDCSQVSLKRLERQANKPVLRRAKKLRRFLNAMSREAPVRFEHGSSWNEVEQVLPHFIEAHVARFLATGRISNLARRERRGFLHELARLLSERGWLNLTRMIRGEKAIAWNYGFQFQGTWFWYQPTFITEMEKYSPGMCLLAKIVEEAAEDAAMTTVDLGLGAEEYKEVFANQSRKTLYITLRMSPVQHAREIGRYYAASAVKASPLIEKRLRAGLARLHHWNDRARGEGIIRALGGLAKGALDLAWSNDEVYFFEGTGGEAAGAGGKTVLRIDLNLLAAAASQYADDEATCAYLVHGASRMRKGDAQGYALVDDARNFLHFAWVTDFEGFHLSELHGKVQAPAADCVLLFDCWTPPAIRGQGYYGEALRLIANLMLDRDKRPWIFSAATNNASLRGLEKAGFHRRYSLVRQHLFGWQRVLGQPPTVGESACTEVSVRS